MHMVEEWRDVPGYEGRYTINQRGEVKILRHTFKTKHGTIGIMPERLARVYKDSQGYPRVHLFNGFKWKAWLLHRVVAMAFIPNPLNKPHINHKDANKSNHSIDNLEWCTPRENVDHAVKMKLQTPFRGEDSGSAKLTEDQVREIRERWRMGGIKQRDLGAIYGVKQYCIWAIVSGKTWRHIA
jgi:hypothetical protein